VKSVARLFQFLGGIVARAIGRPHGLPSHIDKTKLQIKDSSTYRSAPSHEDCCGDLILDDLLYMDIVFEHGFSLPDDNARESPEGV